VIAVNLYEIAKKYIETIEAIERTSNKADLQKLEEQRVIWHNKFIEALDRNGIHYKDRDHVTRIAFRIAKQEL
jgi:hypothetical protein